MMRHDPGARRRKRPAVGSALLEALQINFAQLAAVPDDSDLLKPPAWVLQHKFLSTSSGTSRPQPADHHLLRSQRAAIKNEQPPAMPSLSKHLTERSRAVAVASSIAAQVNVGVNMMDCQAVNEAFHRFGAPRLTESDGLHALMDAAHRGGFSPVLPAQPTAERCVSIPHPKRRPKPGPYCDPAQAPAHAVNIPCMPSAEVRNSISKPPSVRCFATDGSRFIQPPSMVKPPLHRAPASVALEKRLRQTLRNSVRKTVGLVVARSAKRIGGLALMKAVLRIYGGLAVQAGIPKDVMELEAAARRKKEEKAIRKRWIGHREASRALRELEAARSPRVSPRRMLGVEAQTRKKAFPDIRMMLADLEEQAEQNDTESSSEEGPDPQVLAHFLGISTAGASLVCESSMSPSRRPTRSAKRSQSADREAHNQVATAGRGVGLQAHDDNRLAVTSIVDMVVQSASARADRAHSEAISIVAATVDNVVSSGSMLPAGGVLAGRTPQSPATRVSGVPPPLCAAQLSPSLHSGDGSPSWSLHIGVPGPRGSGQGSMATPSTPGLRQLLPGAVTPSTPLPPPNQERQAKALEMARAAMRLEEVLQDQQEEEERLKVAGQ